MRSNSRTTASPHYSCRRKPNLTPRKPRRESHTQPSNTASSAVALAREAISRDNDLSQQQEIARVALVAGARFERASPEGYPGVGSTPTTPQQQIGVPPAEPQANAHSTLVNTPTSPPRSSSSSSGTSVPPRQPFTPSNANTRASRQNQADPRSSVRSCNFLDFVGVPHPSAKCSLVATRASLFSKSCETKSRSPTPSFFSAAKDEANRAFCQDRGRGHVFW